MADAETSSSLGLSRQQVETFAAGLYQLAASDGIDPSEIAIISDFVTEADAPELADRLDALPFDPATAFYVLESSWLRRLFLRAAVLVIRADGVVTDAEQETLSWMAMAFGVTGGYDAVVDSVAGEAL